MTKAALIVLGLVVLVASCSGSDSDASSSTLDWPADVVGTHVAPPYEWGLLANGTIYVVVTEEGASCPSVDQVVQEATEAGYRIDDLPEATDLLKTSGFAVVC